MPEHDRSRSEASSSRAQAIILAGGQGTRLRPLTDTRPKPIVPLLNRPFLEYQIAQLERHGITDILLSCSYRVEDVRAAMGSGAHLGVELRYVVEATPLGTAGGVRNAADLARGHVVVLNGDILADVDLSAVLRFHSERGSRTTICLTPVEDPTQYGLVETEADGAIRRFTEKPRAAEVTTNTINAGIYVIDAELLRRIPEDRAVSIEREFFPALLADRIPCFGFPLSGYWRDIGTPAAYRSVQLDLLEHRLASPLPPLGSRRDGCWIGADARIADGVRLLGPSVIGAHVDAAPGATLGPHAVIGERCRIHAHGRVMGAVLWERVVVGDGAIVEDCLVGADVQIGTRARVGPGAIVETGAVIPPDTRLPR